MQTQPNTNPLKIVLGAPRPGALSAMESQSTQIIAEPFPINRTIRWTPETQSNAMPAVGLVVTQDVLRGVCRHVSQDLSREFGGFLLGNRYACLETGYEYVLIDN